ncbi:hypothetical protein BDV40DRAFT_278344, partial [Aspergillus tamarii]
PRRKLRVGYSYHAYCKIQVYYVCICTVPYILYTLHGYRRHSGSSLIGIHF